jgi:hypothetical protein
MVVRLGNDESAHDLPESFVADPRVLPERTPESLPERPHPRRVWTITGPRSDGRCRQHPFNTDSDDRLFTQKPNLYEVLDKLLEVLIEGRIRRSKDMPHDRITPECIAKHTGNFRRLVPQKRLHTVGMVRATRIDHHGSSEY